MNKITFNRVKQYREKRGWSVKRLAELLDVSEQFIYQLEAMKRDVSMRKARQLCEILGVTLNTLFLP